jgi:hypothetical protein
MPSMPRTIRVVGDERFWVGCFTDQNFHTQDVGPRLELATANSDLRLGIRAAVPFGTAPVGVKVHGVEVLSRRGRNSARERQRTEPEQCLRGTQRTVGENGRAWYMHSVSNHGGCLHRQMQMHHITAKLGASTVAARSAAPPPTRQLFPAGRHGRAAFR